MNTHPQTPTAEFTIRAATLDDSEAIRRIRNSAIRESLAIWTSVEANEEKGRAWLAPQIERGTALVAELGGEVVGFAVASAWHAYEGYARTSEDSIYIDEIAQGKGLGTMLLKALLQASEDAGDRSMIAMIEGSNLASISLHEKLGFDIRGRIPQAGEKAGKILDLVILSKVLNDSGK